MVVLRTLQRYSFMVICLMLLGAPAAFAYDYILPTAADSFVTAGTALDATGTLREALLVDGVPIAFKYDEVWSYSADMLDAVQAAGFIPASYGDYQFSTGTGGLDVLLYTGAVGQDNLGVGPSGTNNFEDPTVNQNDPTFDGWWGQSDQNDDGTLEAVNGPVTVGQVLAYLQEFDPTNDIPVFYMDLNQTGANANLLISAQVSLIDPITGAVIESWALDSINDGTFQEAAQAVAFGELTITGDSGTVYDLNHNLGSGAPDFIAFADDMHLSSYASNLLFVTEFHMDNMNDGFEEIFLTGAAGTIPPPPAVPEPATIVLLGCGMLGVGFYARRRKG